MRVSVLVSGGGSNLQSLLDMCYFRTEPQVQLSAVIASTPDAYALERARRAGIPAYVVERENFPNNASFCNALLGKLRDLDTDLVVLAGFSEKLNYPLLHFYKNRVISTQPALFPAFCARSFDPLRALADTVRLGVRVTGATAYFLTEEDSGFGPIICQRALETRGGESEATLAERIMRECEHVVLPEAVKLFCSGRLRVEGERVVICPEK